jgi:hypothetical protein
MVIKIVENTNLEEFKEEMNKILKEKYPKYKDSWKCDGIGIIRDKMDYQMKSISNIIMSCVDWDQKEVKRKVLHIANYCLFLYNKLSE